MLEIGGGDGMNVMAMAAAYPRAQFTNIDLAATAVARGHCDIASPDSDARLLAIPEIGPWTIQCLGLSGRGDPDSLPAGDLGYIKLVGHLAHLGRRATVPEVEEFYAPYEPYRGLVGSLTLAGLHRVVAEGPRLPLAPDRFDLAA